MGQPYYFLLVVGKINFLRAAHGKRVETGQGGIEKVSHPNTKKKKKKEKENHQDKKAKHKWEISKKKKKAQVGR